MKLAICIVAYNRPQSLHRVLQSIDKGAYGNESVDLIISIDYSGSNVVEQVATKFNWEYGEKKIIAHQRNLGLKAHILSCGEFTKGYDGVIVLEDDIYVAPSFYLYAKACVNKYKNDDEIAGISLYSFAVNYHNMLPFAPLHSDSDVYMMQNAQSWGQVWMPRQWAEFVDWYSKNSEDFPEMPHLPSSICSWKKSWLKYHTRYCIENKKYFVYPYASLSTCFSDEGEHTDIHSTLLQVPLFYGVKSDYNLSPTVSYDAFFENEGVASSLDIKDDEICVDIYGEKGNREKRRYWLTQRRVNFKILKSFALQLKPVEQNVLCDIQGEQIYLYDTSVAQNNSFSTDSSDFERYLYNNFSGIRKLAKQLKAAFLAKIFK